MTDLSSEPPQRSEDASPFDEPGPAPIEADRTPDGLDFSPVQLRPGRRRRAKVSPLRSMVEWAIAIVAALTVSFLVNTFLFQPFRIPSISMYPTLKVGDRVVVNKLSYKLHDVHRGDVVVFTRPSCDPDPAVAHRSTPVWANCAVLFHIDDLIKRVVAVGGDTIEIRSDHVYINGRQLTEPYLAPGATTEPQPIGCGFPGVFTVPKGEVFVMGDNRNHSGDSRCFGPISEQSIVGRAFVRIWPPSRLGGL